MSVVLQASDMHFGTERQHVVEALVALAAELRPELVVLSGDITQRARRRQFAAARRFAERMQGAAILAVPGNHDIPLFNIVARILAPYAGYASAFGSELEPTYESDHFLVMGVNTTRAYRHKHGEVSPEQIEDVARRLQVSPPHKLRIVVTHHPLQVPEGGEERNLLRGHARAARAWADAGADLVMGGHIHLPFVQPAGARLAGLPRPLWVVQAGTAVSWRVRLRATNSINVVRYDSSASSRTCAIERWDYMQAPGRFTLAGCTPVELER